MVTDAHDHTPMGFASVSILNVADSSLLVGAYTDDKGKFQLRFSSGDTVLMKVSYLGYQSKVRPVHFSRGVPDLQLGGISLAPLSNTLQTVTIAAEKKQMYEFKRDSVVFNVPEDFMTGGTAMDVLEYAPTLTFDANDNIMVKGQGNVQVYVDSKPIALTGMDVKTYLNNTPSFMIERIEILKTPPDPEDAAEALAEGITDRYYLNIITRKIRFHGYSTGLTGGLNSRRELTGRLRFNMNLSPFKLNYFNNLHYRTDSNYLHRTSFLTNSDSSVLDQRSYSTHMDFDQYLNAQYEFKFSDKERLRLDAKAGWNQNKGTSTNISMIDNPKGTADQNRIQKSHSRSNGYNVSTDADYRKEYDKEGKELTATMDFSQSNSRNNTVSLGRYLINDDTLNQLNEGNSHQMNLRGNIQYKNTFGNEKFYLLNGATSFAGRHNLNNVSRSDTALSSSKMEADDQLSTNYYSSSSHYSVLALLGKHDQKLGWVAAASVAYYLQDGSDHYQLSTFDNRAFVSHNAIGMNYSPGKDQELTFHFNPGFESYTQDTRANDTVPELTYRYTNFIPGASAKYTIGDHELTLSYKRDVDRPEWDQLNPYIDNRDPLNIRKGNPELRPTFTNKYHLRYEYNHQAIYVAFDMEKDIAKDVISSYRTVDSSGVSTRTYVNLNDRKRDNAGLDVGTHYFKDIPSLKGNLNINAEVGVDAYHLQSTDPHVSKDYQDVSGFSSHFKLWSSIRLGFFSLMVNGRYSGPRYFSQGKRPSRFSSGLRVKGDFMKRRLNITMGIENVFGASVKDSYYKTDRYVQYSNNRKNVRYFSLYITYKLRKYSKLGNDDNNG
ncbi:MAG TPA: outer membrane beta-barrel family protein [Chitinophagaceae bacterium]|nr:outer membrane beta-barrel family protein [Chitinophagaceae bacterium]